MKTIQKKKKVLKSKSAFVKIKLDIYDAYVIVSINQTDQEFQRSYIKNNPASNIVLVDQYVKDTAKISERELGKTIIYGGCVTVRLYSDLSTSIQMGTLVHELFHATDMILDDKGLQLVAGSDEAYSYLIGYLMEKTMDSYK